MGPIYCPETSARNNKLSHSNMQEERRAKKIDLNAGFQLLPQEADISPNVMCLKVLSHFNIS